jgi:hypothetical protein
VNEEFRVGGIAQLQEPTNAAARFTSPTDRTSQNDDHDFSSSSSSVSSSHDQGLSARSRAPKFFPGPSESNAILFQLCTDVSQDQHQPHLYHIVNIHHRSRIDTVYAFETWTETILAKTFRSTQNASETVLQFTAALRTASHSCRVGASELLEITTERL